MRFLYRRLLNSKFTVFLFNPRLKKPPINERYETTDCIPQVKQVSQLIYPKRFDIKISDKSKNIPFRERYETIDF